MVQMLSFLAGLQVVVWEVCYWCWWSLNESMYHISGDNIDHIDSTSHPQQARSLSLFSYSNDFMFKNHRMLVFNGKIWLRSLLLWLKLAGSCVQAKNFDVLGTVIANKHLPDRMCVIQDPLPLIEDSTSDDEDSNYEGTVSPAWQGSISLSGLPSACLKKNMIAWFEFFLLSGKGKKKKTSLRGLVHATPCNCPLKQVFFGF